MPGTDPTSRPQRTLAWVLAAAALAVAGRAAWDLRTREVRILPSPATFEERPVDLNSADPLTLSALPGIGPKTARLIVERRDALGGFRSVEELLDVDGIGPRTLERVRPCVTVSPPDP
jgi:competence ComEA-like helix-hairpin-helix protein